MNVAELEKIMVRFGQLVVEHPIIAEMDINPLFVSDKRIVALDARIVVHPAETPLHALPASAIRPYPVQYISTHITPDGETFTVRPIRPEDEPLSVAFHMGLSEQTVKLRYMYDFPLEERITHERLAALCYIDYDREIALIATQTTPDGITRMVAVGRLQMLSGTRAVAEFGLLVADDCQGKGLGTTMLSQLMDIGKREGVKRIFGKLLIKNSQSVEFLHRLGFTTQPMEDQLGVLIGMKEL